MSRTKLRQVEQILSSEVYDDQLNQTTGTGSATEGKAGATIGANNPIVSTTANTIVVGEDLISLGLNTDDTIVLSGTACDGTYQITGLVFGSPNTTVTVNPVSVEGVTLLVGQSGNAQATIDSTKSVERDLNHIRTQIRKIAQTSNWYDPPETHGVNAFFSSTSTAISSGNSIDVGGNFDAGSPYDLSVFLNGELLMPSTISGGSVTTEYDYQELDDNDDLVGSGEVGGKIAINFDIVSGDVLQFVWNKQERSSL